MTRFGNRQQTAGGLGTFKCSQVVSRASAGCSTVSGQDALADAVFLAHSAINGQQFSKRAG
ncbi:MAG: hypothetical protein DWI25_06790 [Planctomycetota bacterium]|nr:MAG: hypothetical protein DWI25_06790 [Planctomycetota bacterium]